MPNEIMEIYLPVHVGPRADETSFSGQTELMHIIERYNLVILCYNNYDNNNTKDNDNESDNNNGNDNDNTFSILIYSQYS